MGSSGNPSSGPRGAGWLRAVIAGIAGVAVPAVLAVLAVLAMLAWAAGFPLGDFPSGGLPVALPQGLLPDGPFPGSPFSGSPAEVDRLAAGAIALGALAVAAWWLLSWAAAVASVLLQRGGRPGAARRVGRLSPRSIRRLAAAALGTHLVLGPPAHAALPAHAELPAHASAWSPAGALAPAGAPVPLPQAAVPQARSGPESAGSAEGVPGPGWTPERPATPLDPVLGGVRDGAAREVEGGPLEVVVRAGDSLWSVAARSLGPHATATQIAREWPRWYLTNRAVVGENPDLLLAGTVLLRPAGVPEQENPDR